ncbi:MAG: site-2 protease family protein [Clostridia bacterium]
MKKWRIDVGLDFVLVIAVFFCLDTQNMFIIAIMAALAHEIGHIIAIWLCGGYVERVHVGAFGAEIKISPYPMIGYAKEIVIAAAGPLCGAVAAAVAAAFHAYLFAGLSLVLTLFNLLPAFPLDGGRIVHAAAMLIGGKYANKVCTAFSAVAAVAVAAACVVVNIKAGFTLSLTLFCAFIIISFAKNVHNDL